MSNKVAEIYSGNRVIHRNYVGYVDDKGCVWDNRRNIAGRIDSHGRVYKGNSNSNLAGRFDKLGYIYIGRSSNVPGRIDKHGYIYHKRSSNVIGVVTGSNLLYGAAAYLLLFHESSDSNMDVALKAAAATAAVAWLLSDDEDSEESNSESCYIATAVYKDYNAPEVLVLREFRDRYLYKKYFGRLLIQIYYLLSPPIAKRLKNAKRMNFIIKAILDKIVRIIYKCK